MTPGGWIFLISTWGLIILVAVYCFSRVFQNEAKEKTGGDN